MTISVTLTDAPVGVTVSANAGSVSVSAATVSAVQVGVGETATPTTHGGTHAAGGSDPITLAVSQVTGLQTALDNKADATHGHIGNDVTIYNEDGDYPATVSDTNVEVFLWNVSTQSQTRTGFAARQAVNRVLIDAAAASHTHTASEITSGTLSDSRLSTNARQSVESFVHPFLLGGL
jgi:hypothetical protein